jgi:hypothetical protein
LTTIEHHHKIDYVTFEAALAAVADLVADVDGKAIVIAWTPRPRTWPDQFTTDTPQLGVLRSHILDGHRAGLLNPSFAIYIPHRRAPWIRAFSSIGSRSAPVDFGLQLGEIFQHRVEVLAALDRNQRP